MPTRDASSPARVNNTATTDNETGTTASFNPPADSWLYATMCIDTGAPSTPTFSNPTNTGTALTWSLVDSLANANGGAVAVWRAYNANAQTGITVTTGVSNTSHVGTNNPAGSTYVDVWTGCHTTQTGAATAKNTTTTQTINPTVTTTAAGSRVVAGYIDWNQNGTVTSSDTIDAFNNIGIASGARLYKASDSGAAGSVAINVVAAGGSPISTYILYEIKAAAGGDVSVALTGQVLASARGSFGAQADKALTGQSLTSSLGTPSPATSITPTGQLLTGSLGSFIVSNAVPLVGLQMAISQGTLTAEGGNGGDVTLALTGQSLASAAGTLLPAVSLTLTGQSLTIQQGTLLPALTVTLDGQLLAFTQGDITPTTGVVVELTGLSMSAAQGDLGVVNDGIVPTPDPVNMGLGGGGTGLGYDRHRQDRKLKKILDDVVAEVMYRDLVKTADAPKAAKLVKPFAESKRIAIPKPEAIDWQAVERDATRVRQLVSMWNALQRRREIHAADDEWLMLGD